MLHVVFAPPVPRALLLGWVRLENRGAEPLALEYTETWDVPAGVYSTAPAACERRFGGHVFALADCAIVARADPPAQPPARGLALDLRLALPPGARRHLAFAYVAVPEEEDPGALRARVPRGRRRKPRAHRPLPPRRGSLSRARPIHSLTMLRTRSPLRLCSRSSCSPSRRSRRSARAGNSTDIVRETARTLEGGGGRVASFWWLPQEYWELVAKELGIPAEEQAKVRTVFRDYLLVGALESKLNTDKKPEFASIADLAKRAKFYRNGEEVEVLRDVNPELARLAPSLVYLLRASLGGLGEGLRLLPLSERRREGQSDPLGATARRAAASSSASTKPAPRKR